MNDPVRIIFQAPAELEQAIRDEVGNKRGASISAFLRTAAEEKLGRTEADPQTSSLLHLFSQLNERGKAWLLECATIASTCDSMRHITKRKGHSKQ